MGIRSEELEEKRNHSTALRFKMHDLECRYGLDSPEAKQARREYEVSLQEAETAVIQWIRQGCKEEPAP